MCVKESVTSRTKPLNVERFSVIVVMRLYWGIICTTAGTRRWSHQDLLTDCLIDFIMSRPLEWQYIAIPSGVSSFLPLLRRPAHFWIASSPFTIHLQVAFATSVL